MTVSPCEFPPRVLFPVPYPPPICFLNFTMGGVWTLAGALPIFNRINYRRGCSYEEVFPACHCDPELVSGEAISNHLLVGGILRPFRLRRLVVG